MTYNTNIQRYVPHSYEETVAPIDDPVELEVVKNHLRVVTKDDDKAISRMLHSARREVERLCEIVIIQRTMALYLDWFPECIELRKVPVSSVTSIAYYDSTDTLQTLATSVYATDLTTAPPIIVEKPGQTWPNTKEDKKKAVVVTFVAGHGTAPEDVPEDIQQVLLLKVEQEYYGKYDDPNFTRAVDRMMDQISWSMRL